jgi:predicted nucleic acid-binding protein
MVTPPGARRRDYLGHQRVLIDTNVWLYHLEGNAEFGAAASELISAVELGVIEGVASELTLLELQVRPLRLERQDIADHYEILLDHFPHLVLAPVIRDVLTLAAVLRAKYNLKTPDAIVLATGIRHGATLAVSNDQQWKRVAEITTKPLKGQRPA